MLTPFQSWTLQIAILSTGIYVFLRFLRTTRGSGLLRGLLVAFFFGAVGLLGLSQYLAFDELNHIIESVTPYVAVILVIIFQPELRRAMARLGQHNRFAQLFTSGRKDMVSRVARAATAMASRRHGALIAFQQETPLDAWTANAAHIDAEISTTLLESIFHPGAALHDGAVVIEGDRVVAAACLFPLTENIQLSKSTGTRHRAALGLTEETDAVTLIVSEETGSLSIARQGFMSRDIPAADIEQSLRDALGLASGDEDPNANKGSSWSKFIGSIKEFFTEDLLRKGSSLALATGMIYLAHQDILVWRTLSMQVLEIAPGAQARPSSGLFQVRLPEHSFHLVAPTNGTEISVLVHGTPANLDRFGGGGGFLDVSPDIEEGAMDIPIDEISWTKGSSELEFAWAGNRTPQLEVQYYSTHRMTLRPEHVTVDSSKLDPHFEIPGDGISFAHDSVEIQGPRDVIEGIRAGSLQFLLEPIVIQSTDRDDRRELLGLAPSMSEESVSIVGTEKVSVEVKIDPAVVPLDDIEVDLAIVNFRPDSGIDTSNWTLSQADEKARFSLRTAGLFDSGPSTRAFEETRQLIREYALENLDAYVDLSELVEGENTVSVYSRFPDNWLEQLFPGREAEFADSARLDVELQSEPKVLLIKKN